MKVHKDGKNEVEVPLTPAWRGQIQRIAIVRAVFSDRPILILDEATSALDEQTEEWLLENLRQMTDKTVLIITHRPAALRICDRKIVMSESE